MPFTKEKPHIYYEVKGNGPTILFIPPPAMGHLTFRYQYKLSDHYQIITLDIRGDCKSEKALPVTMELFVSDIKRVLDELQVEKAIICGYSNGGVIAQAFAASHPNRIIGLILIGGYYEVASFLLKKEYQLGIWIAKQKWMSLLASALSFNHFSSKKAANEMAIEMKQTDPDMLEQQYAIGMNYSNKHSLTKLDVPLLLIYGARDIYIHHYQHLYQEVIKDVEIAYIDKSKHQVPTKHDHECNAIIKQWIRSKDLAKE
ncbi:alpha/beta fold hydrolase [Gracilibacillus dipsosauri]|uniref:alpha/beta fold hydrolase n=1 Tax=Gracilibacillus dipsosauri TaxID=178340 RepID=UPI00240A918B